MQTAPIERLRVLHSARTRRSQREVQTMSIRRSIQSPTVFKSHSGERGPTVTPISQKGPPPGDISILDTATVTCKCSDFYPKRFAREKTRHRLIFKTIQPRAPFPCQRRRRRNLRRHENNQKSQRATRKEKRLRSNSRPHHQ